MVTLTGVYRAGAFLLGKTFVYSSLLVILAIVSWEFIRPLQMMVFRGDQLQGTLIFLPFALKVICAYFEGWRSLLLLAPGALIANQVLWGLPLDQIGTWQALAWSYSIAPLGFTLLAAFSGMRPGSLDAHRGWRVLALVGIFSAFVGQLGVHMSAFGGNVEINWRLLMTYAVGDLLGLVALAFVLHYGRRLFR